MQNYQSLIKYQHQQEREQKIIGRIMGFALVFTFFIVMPLITHFN